MAGLVEVRWIVPPRQLTERVYDGLQRASTRILQERIIPQAPIDKGDLRASLGTEVRAEARRFIAYFASTVDYAKYLEWEPWASQKTPRTPGTRIPFIQPGILESVDILEEEIGIKLGKPRVIR